MNTPPYRPLIQKVYNDPSNFIVYAYNLLLRVGFEGGMAPDYAHSSLITFPGGDNGAFVSIGFSGVTRGYLILLRLKANSIEPVQILPSDFDWGAIAKDPTGHDSLEETGIESLELLPSPNLQSKQILTVSGWSHMGAGLLTDEFQIADITNSGIRIIFTGILDDGVFNNGGYYHEYQYDYADLDGNGTKEIIQVGRECKVQYVQEPYGISDCIQMRRIYKFNGVEYAQQSQ